MLTRDELVQSLPMGAGELEIRLMRRADMDERAGWPLYPFPYHGFNGNHANTTPQERDRIFRERQIAPNSLPLVADCGGEAMIAYMVLNEIDWDAGVVGNLGFRVKPTWCDRGIGTLMMRAVVAWLFGHGFGVIRFDVSAANPRAIHCYEKCGFTEVGEFWRDDESLRSINLDDPQYDFLRPHVRFDGGRPQVRFYWMELVNG